MEGQISEGVKDIMGGKVLDYEAKKIKMEGLEEGISQGITQGMQLTLINLVREGLLSAEEAAKRLNKSMSEIKLLI